MPNTSSKQSSKLIDKYIDPRIAHLTKDLNTAGLRAMASDLSQWSCQIMQLVRAMEEQDRPAAAPGNTWLPPQRQNLN